MAKGTHTDVVVSLETSSLRSGIEMECEGEETSEPIYFLPILSHLPRYRIKVEKGKDEDEPTDDPAILVKRFAIDSIVLQCSGSRQGHFRRIGCLQIAMYWDI
ncbi:hypothetical protein MCOR25_004979 [Pyricularia grisea]|uniref:Uncharacterized protein n=1 Tax=Pyricularia grisea TaxID=148305 RepID=A0A6P8AVU1_PYRGI|nr:uncharacterized protein PgNI_08468 [Pyricularia grisea]KAI6367246.1 hypothetical protein MCOR25_004979 [Pyricularia grisea]TLD06346.1 hypothetical protein PgNI_08468 [Pyricularia grisea]